MERLSLREAATRTSLSVTTLRRYIRSGRLRAEKCNGRFGPEYFVSEGDLEAAGLDVAPASSLPVPRAHDLPVAPLERVLRDTGPVDLFRDLQMKHEQLLVQYGMVRAAGLRFVETRDESESRRKQVDDLRTQITRLKESFARESVELRRKTRAAELEAEGFKLEAAALREKVRGLEMLTRNAVTSETIDRKFEEILSQSRRVERLEARAPGLPSGRPVPSAEPTDHRAAGSSARRLQISLHIPRRFTRSTRSTRRPGVSRTVSIGRSSLKPIHWVAGVSHPSI